MDDGYVHEVPSSLKQLARLVARAFYTIEDALIIDMLVRNPCMKDDDISDLLKFERKMLRGRITLLRNDKFLQTRLKMETVEGKSQKVNYYYINYKIFVNIVKYKLDHMRKKMETSERDATSRASFHCPGCKKNFTDLEADRLFNPMDPTGEFKCNFCGAVVVEDESALPKTDSRQLMARFNDQMEPLYKLLREVEDVKLAPALLEPEPTDISHLQRDADGKPKTRGPLGENWSGEATRGGGFRLDEQRVDVTIGDNMIVKKGEVRKEAPIWMRESTVDNEAATSSTDNIAGPVMMDEMELPTLTSEKNRNQEDIMSVLMELEKPSTKAAVPADSSDDEAAARSLLDQITPAANAIQRQVQYDSDVELMDSDSEEEVPMVRVGNLEFPVHEVPSEQIARMTPSEKDAYVQLHQEYMERMGYLD
uniref:General transcription factor IIE subunit 1 n=1 Tax=Daphnia galeata TaxID=27404 RepID=A0A8J2RKA6_9CRUS|nr:unnamed protein product [Daphnia galeata]